MHRLQHRASKEQCRMLAGRRSVADVCWSMTVIQRNSLTLRGPFVQVLVVDNIPSPFHSLHEWPRKKSQI